jgi:heterotetrameric sarcosine oxidase gamma subunit
MPETTTMQATQTNRTPIARSPIRQRPPVAEHASWEVSRASATAPLRLADLTPLAKILVRAGPASAAAGVLACEFGHSRRTASGELVIGCGPGEWLLLAPASTHPSLAAQLSPGGGESRTIIDATHGRVVLRLTGADAARTLEKLCAIDLSDKATPNRAAFRSSVARLACLVVRDDLDGIRSYLICSDRSYGQYLFDALADAGAEYSFEQDGYPDKEI